MKLSHHSKINFWKGVFIAVISRFTITYVMLKKYSQRAGVWVTFLVSHMNVRVSSRFFVQAGHLTTFRLSFRWIYQNYQQSWQKLGTFSESKVHILKITFSKNIVTKVFLLFAMFDKVVDNFGRSDDGLI